MNAPHITHYECTVYYTSTGSSHTKLYPFTQAQATKVGAVIEADGLPMWAALKLCEEWTRLGAHQGLRYTYRIP